MARDTTDDSKKTMDDMASTVRRLYADEVLARTKKKPIKAPVVLPRILTQLYIWVTVLTILTCIGLIISYNQLVTFEEQVKADYGHVEAELQRRNNLYINMVNLYMSYAELETKIFVNVSEVRSKVGDMNEMLTTLKTAAPGLNVGAGQVDFQAPVSELSGALSKLMAVVEQYPQLQASQPLQLLVEKLVDTENRISEGRTSYNEAVRQFNNMLNHFPYRYMAWFLGFERQYYYEAASDVRQVPAITSNSPYLSIRENAANQSLGERPKTRNPAAND